MVDEIKERILIEIEEFKLGGITPFEDLNGSGVSVFR